ncbi:unnamed protein product [Litomosoides sigmodontis]|uniref:C2 tensin-type domain-containing protein n=1 Tax=Litomosoides sigmodontis TaxID=42156 RepID=A0A3P6U9P1_LITSI|nr:unnamed protein product [Litomosoides sigmodontis]
MSWLKNIKDKTTAVAQTVQSTYGNRGPDVTFVTSRLVIAPLADGIPEALVSQAEEAMRAHILDQARGQFAIYNLSNRHLRCEYDHLIETPLPVVGSGLTPTVNFLLNLCRNMVLFLKQKKTNFILITGPEVQCLLVAAALILYARLVPKPLVALELICTKRQPPSLPPSYHLQLDVIKTVVSVNPTDLCAIVHNRRVVLQSLLISPVPLFNRVRSGCRPFADVYAGGTKVWSTCKSYEELKSFESSESFLVDLQLGDIPVGGDVQIVVYHARLMKMQNRMQQHLMFSLIFHANFIDPNTHMLEFNLGDLDRASDDSRFGTSLRIGLHLKIDEHDRGFSVREPPAILSYEPKGISTMLLVSEPDEFDAIVRHLCLHHKPSNEQNLPEGSLPPQKCVTGHHKAICEEEKKATELTTPSHPQDSFFSTLDWVDDTNISNSGVTKKFVNKAWKFQLLEGAQDTDLYERVCDIHINTAEDEISDNQCKFDCEEQPECVEKSASKFPTTGEDADLLGLGTDFHISCSSSVQLVNGGNDGSFSLSGVSAHNVGGVSSHASDDFSSTLNTHFGNNDFCENRTQNNICAPIFSNVDVATCPSEVKIDPLSDFFACAQDDTALPLKSSSAGGRKTGSNNQQQPSCSQTYFDTINSSKGGKLKNFENAFDDLLTSQGFRTSAKTTKCLGEMKRQEEIKELDPITIKVKEWTNGKERNIRALLGSMNNILWPDAENWVQPSIGDLLTAQQIKKYYHKACLVIHPDKQVGTENEMLARAIFTELNDAWTAYENAGSPSI